MRLAAVIAMVMAMVMSLAPEVCRGCCAMQQGQEHACCAGAMPAVRGECCTQVSAPAVRTDDFRLAPIAGAGGAASSVVTFEPACASGDAGAAVATMPERPRPQRVLRI